MRPATGNMKRGIRYQGAVIRGDHILLIKHREHESGREYWVLPGGRRRTRETGEACVRREINEETRLTVSVGRLLLDEGIASGFYKRYRTYLCEVVSGEAEPGFEPEADATWYDIVEVRWFDLRRSYEWEDGLTDNPVTFPLLLRIRAVLGYTEVSAEATE